MWVLRRWMKHFPGIRCGGLERSFVRYYGIIKKKQQQTRMNFLVPSSVLNLLSLYKYRDVSINIDYIFFPLKITSLY